MEGARTFEVGQLEDGERAVEVVGSGAEPAGEGVAVVYVG